MRFWYQLAGIVLIAASGLFMGGLVAWLIEKWVHR